MAKDLPGFLAVLGHPKDSDDEKSPDSDSGEDAADPKEMKVSCAKDILQAVKDDDAEALAKYLDEFSKYPGDEDESESSDEK